MQPEEYRNIIQLAIYANPGKIPSEVTEEIIKHIQAFNEMMGVTAASPVKPVSIQTGMDMALSSLDKKFVSEAILIGEPPPVAGVSPAEYEDEEPTDQWESSPGKGNGAERLSRYLASKLPNTIDVAIAGLTEPVTLIRNINSPGPGMPFVNVVYSIAGQSDGPRIMVMTTTSTVKIDQQAMVADITSQATSQYSTEKRVVQPNTKRMPPPSSIDFVNASQESDAQAGAVEFGRLRA